MAAAKLEPAKVRRCKDCVVENGGAVPRGGFRPSPHPGPRCYTHWNIEKNRRKEAQREVRREKLYGLKPGEYEKLYAAQGGKCWLCQRATGASRALSVDHDHATGEVRGLICRPDNDLLGHARDDPEFFFRCIDYLRHPPARRFL